MKEDGESSGDTNLSGQLRSLWRLSVFQFTLWSFVPVMSRATTPPLFSPLFSHVWQISFLLCSPEKRGEKSLNENTWVQLFLETLCVWEVSCQRRFHAWHFALSSTGMLIAFMKEEVEGKSHTHTHTLSSASQSWRWKQAWTKISPLKVLLTRWLWCIHLCHHTSFICRWSLVSCEGLVPMDDV